MPEENNGLKNKQEANGQSGNATTNCTTSRRIDTYANIAIWGAVIAWGCFLLFVLISAMILSIPSFPSSIANVIVILIFSATLSSLISIFSGFFGILRTRQRKNEFSGTGRAIIGILLSIAFWLIAILPAIHKCRYRMDDVKSIKTEEAGKLKYKAEANEINQPASP